MESLSLRHMISAVYCSLPLRRSVNPFHMRTTGTKLRHFRLILHSKKGDFQDFQVYAKPTRLLPASEVEICTNSTLEEIINSFKIQSSESLFKVKIKTSVVYGSGLTDLNSGVLLCLIDENGYSVLQRIPSCHAKTHSKQLEGNATPEVLHFQRGSVDEFVFKGPSLGKVAALWISLDSGQWRVGQLSLTVICQHVYSSAETDKKSSPWIGFHYGFELEDTLLGEGSDISVMEVRPSSFTAFSSQDDYTSLNVNMSEPSLLSSFTLSNQESMKEYADLKLSLLIYDAMFVVGGSTIASFSRDERAAIAFFAGGVGGFLYLLLLQRSVDTLPAPELASRNRTSIWNEILGKVKDSSATSLVLLTLAFAVGIIADKYTSGDVAKFLTPKELIFGMMGFLMCKISVVLAAFKPIRTGLRQDN